MITGWRPERQIGNPGMLESVGSLVKWPFIFTAISAIFAVVAVLLKVAFGGLSSPTSQVLFGCIVFVGAGLYCSVVAVRAHQWVAGLITIIVTTGLAVLAWYFTLPLLDALGLIEIVATVPVSR